ncbi:NERD domain-containing protein [Intrasporangium sp. YIM S08009]|uniref:NERD domain-containing protein n=1 Tax=Intrasporangium zincisolvens TaxID=3080018 RepID=UPI002B053E1A|nr:NERD domain-containing protein [Intrasporangium sp. YIM S08009]
MFRVLHDRRVPRSRANIDHVVVCASGVVVIDAKRYKGRPRHVVEGGFLRPRVDRLLVGTRDCTRLVTAVLGQADVVRTVLGPDVGPDVDVDVTAALCFVDADWPLIGGSFVIDGVAVTWSRRLVSVLGKPGPLDADTIADLHRRLATALPPA